MLRYPIEMNLEIVLAMTVQPATAQLLLVANATSSSLHFIYICQWMRVAKRLTGPRSPLKPGF
jgi:hypothetical protein